MKVSVAALSLALGLSSIAPAITVGPDIRDAQIKQQIVEHIGKISLGDVQIDLRNKKIDLGLKREWYCPPNAICSMVMPSALQVSVPLIQVTTGNCGEHIYSGAQDLTPADGDITELEVIDYSHSQCRAIAPTVVTLRHRNVRTRFDQKSVIAAEQLFQRLY